MTKNIRGRWLAVTPLIGALVLGSCGGTATPSSTAAAPTVAAPAATLTVAPALAYTPATTGAQAFVWTKAPAAYPAGAEISVLEGDTSKPGPFTLRLRFPDGYAIPPHSHPIDEHVTVIQGTFFVGMGTSGSKEAATEMPTGSFVLIPNLTKHYIFTKGVTIVQVHSVGPSALNYVNASDDPRKPSPTP